MSGRIDDLVNTVARTFMLENLDAKLQDATLRSLFATFRQMLFSMLVSALISFQAYQLSGDAFFRYCVANTCEGGFSVPVRRPTMSGCPTPPPTATTLRFPA